MAHCPRLNNSGLPLYHLSRFGPPASLPTVPDVMDLNRVTTIIGRNPQQANYVLDSSNLVQRAYISRLHARIIREGSQHKLYDDSLNGVFINHIKITGFVILNEGDLVTFGHPNGKNVPGGTRKRQSESEYQFLFGRCDCGLSELTPATTQHSSTPTAIPEVQVPVRPLERRPDIGQATGGSPSQSPSQSAIKKGHIKSESVTLPACQQAPAAQPDKGCGSPQGVITAVDSEPKSEYPGSKRSRDSSGDFDDVVAVPSGGSIQNSPETKPDESCSYGSKSVTKDGTNTEDALPVPIVCQTEDDEESDEGFTDEAPIVVIDISSDSEENDESMKEEDNSVCVKTEQKGCVEIHDSDTDAANKCLQSSSSCMNDCGDAQPLTKRLKIEPSDYESTDKTLSTNAQYFCANSTSPVFSTSARKRKFVSHGNTRLKRPKKQWTFSAPIEVASSSYKVVESSQESYPSSESEVTEHSLSLCSSPDPSLEASEGLLEPQGSFQHSEDPCYVEQSKKDRTPRGVPEPSLEASEGLLEPQGSIQHSEDDVEQSKKDMTPQGHPEPQSTSVAASKGLSVSPSYVPPVKLSEMPKDIPDMDQSVEVDTKETDLTPISEKPMIASVVDSEPMQSTSAESVETPADGGEHLVGQRQESHKSQVSETQTGSSVLPVSSHADGESTVLPSTESLKPPRDDGDVSEEGESPTHDTVQEVVQQDDGSSQHSPSEPDCGDIQVTDINTLKDQADSESSVIGSGGITDSKYIFQESRSYDIGQADNESNQHHDTSSNGVGSEGNDKMSIQVTTEPVLNSLQQEQTLCASRDVSNPVPSDEVDSIGQSSLSCEGDISGSTTGGFGGHEKTGVDGRGVPDQKVSLPSVSSSPECLEKGGHVPEQPESSVVCEQDAVPCALCVPTNSVSNVVCDPTDSVPNIICDRTDASVCEQTDTGLSLMCERRNDFPRVGCVQSDDVSERTNCLCVDLKTAVHKEDESDVGMNACESRSVHGSGEHSVFEDSKENCARVVPVIKEIHTKGVLSQDNVETPCRNRGPDIVDSMDQITPITRQLSIPRENSPTLVEDQLLSSVESQPIPKEEVFLVAATEEIKERICLEKEELRKSTTVTDGQGRHSKDNVSPLTEVDTDVVINPSHITYTHPSQSGYSKSDVPSENSYLKAQIAVEGTGKEVKREALKVHSESSDSDDMVMSFSPCKVVTVESSGGEEVLKELPGKVVTIIESTEDEDAAVNHSSGTVVTTIDEDEDLACIDCPENVVTKIESTQDDDLALNSPGKAVITIESTQDEDVVLKELPGNKVTKIESTQGEDLAVIGLPGKVIIVDSTEDEEVVKDSLEKVITVDSTGDEEIVLKELPGKAVTIIESTEDGDAALNHSPGMEVTTMESTEDEDLAVQDRPERLVTKVDTANDLPSMNLPGKIVTIIESTEDEDAALNHSSGMVVTTMESTEDEDLAFIDSPENEVTKIESTQDEDLALNSPGKTVMTIESTEDEDVALNQSPGMVVTTIKPTENDDLIVIDSPGKVITVESTEDEDEDVALKASPGKVVMTIESTQDEDVVLKELPGNIVTKIESTQGEDLAVIGSPGKVIIVDSTEDEEVVKDSPGNVVKKMEPAQDEDLALMNLPVKEVMTIESTEDEDLAVIDSPEKVITVDSTGDEEIVLKELPGKAVMTIESTEDEDLAVIDSPEKVITVDSTGDEEIVLKELPGKAVTIIESTEDGDAALNHSPGMEVTTMESTEDEDLAVQDRPERLVTKVDTANDLPSMNLPGKIVTTIELTEDSAVVMGSTGKMATAVVSTEDEDVVEDSSGKVITVESTEDKDLAVMNSPGKEVTTVDSNLQASRLQPSKCGIHLETTCDKNSDFEKDMCLLSDNMKEKPKEDLFHENMDAAVSQIENVIAHQFDTEQQHSADEDRKHVKSSQEPHDADVQEVVTQGIRVRDNDNCALENILAGCSTTVLEHNVEGTHMTDGMNTALEEKTGSQESGSLSAASVNHISDSAKGTGGEEVKDVAHAKMFQRSDGMEPSKSDGGHILKVDVDTIEDEDELSPVIPHQEPFTSPKKSEPKQEDSAPSELEFFPESQPDFHLYLSQAEESAAMMPDNSKKRGDSDTSLSLYDEVTGQDPECQGDNEAEETTIEGQGDRQTDVTTSENPQCQGDMQTDVTASKDPEGQGGNEADVTASEHQGQGDNNADETTNEHPQGQADNEADVTTFDDTEGQADNEAEVTISESPEGQADNEADVTMSEGPEGQADNEADVTMSEGPEGQADNEADVTMSEGPEGPEGQANNEADVTVSEDPEGQADNEADVTMSEGPEGQADNEADVTMSEGPEGQADNEADVTMSEGPEGPEGQANNEADVTVSEDPEGQADNEADVTVSEDPEGQADNYIQTDMTTFGNPESQSNNEAAIKALGAPEGQDDKCANVKVKNQSDEEVTSMLPNEQEVDTEGRGDYEATSVLSNETQVEDALGHDGIEAHFVFSNEPAAENPEGHGDNDTTVIKPDMATVVGLEGGDDFGCCGRPRSDVFQTEQGEQTASEPSETRGENSAQETDVLSLKVTMNDETDRRTLKEEGPVSQNRSVSQQNEAFGCKSKMEVDNSTHSVAMNKGSLVTAGSSLLSHGDNHIPIIDKMFTVACSKCSFEKSPLFGTRRLQSESSDCMTCAKQISVPLGQAAKSDVDKTKLHDENKHGNCISKQIIQKDKDQEETFEFSLLGTDFSASTPKSSSVSDSLIVNCDGLSYQDISYSIEPGLSSTTDVEETSETEQDPEGSCQAGADVELQDGSECHAAASDGVLLTESNDLNKSSHISNRKEMMRSCRLSDETELHLQLSGIESQTSNVESCSGLIISQPELKPPPTGTHDADDVNETVAEGDNDVARPAASPHKLASEEETLISDEDLHLVMTTSDESQLHNDSALSAESTEVFFVSPVIKFKASKETESSKMLGTICEGEPLCSSSTEQRWIPSASELDSSQLNLLQEISQSSCNSDKGELTAESIALETITDDNSTCTQESMMSGIAPLELSVDAEESDEETEEASQGTSFHHEQKVETSLTSSLPSESHHETVSGNLTVGRHSKETKDQPCGQGYGFAKYGDTGGAVKIVRKDISSRSDSGCDDHTTKEQPSTIGLYRSMSDSKPTFIAEPLFRVDDSNTIIFDAIEDIQRSERKPSLDEDQSFHEKSNMGEVSSSVDMVEQEQACPLSSSPSAVTDGEATEKRDNMSAMDLKSAGNRTTLLQPECSVSDSQKSLSPEVNHNSDEVPDLDYSPDPEEPGHEHDKVTSRLVDDHHATEISNKTNETDITLEVNEYGAISSRAVGSEKVKIDDGVVLTRMKMMNYVDSVPDSEDSLAIIDLRDDMPKEREQCSMLPTDSRQMSGLNKMTTSDKSWDELDGLSEEHLPNCNLDAQDSSPFPAPRLDDTNVEAGKMDASVDVSELVTDDVRGGGVAEGTSHLPHGSSPEEQCMPIIVECWSNAPHSRKRKASEDRAVKKRSCRASLSLKACLGSKVAEFFLIRERVKTFMPCNPISDKETSMACQNSGQAQEQNSLRKGKQGLCDDKQGLSDEKQGLSDDKQGLCDVKQGPSDDKQVAEQQHIKDDNHEFGAEQHGHQETRNEQSIIIDGDSSNRESNLINVKQKMTSTSHAVSHDVDAAGDGETAVDVDSIKEEVEVIESPILDPAIDVHEGTVGSASGGVMEKICGSIEAKRGPLGGLEHPCIIVDRGEVIVITDSEDEVETDNILPMETSKSDPPGGDKMFDQDDDMLLEKTPKSDITEGSKQMYNQDGDVLLKDTSNSDTFDGSEMFDQDGDVLLKDTSNSDALEGRKAIFDQDGEVLLKETSDSDPTEGGKETYNQDDDVLLKETPNSDMPEGSKEIFEKDKAISREETSHSDTSAESKSMFEKDGDMKLECDEESFCTDEDKPETESEETCEGSWKDDLEDETTETSTDNSGDRLIDSDDFEAYTDEDTPEPVLDMDADTEEDPVHLSDTTEDILDTSDQRLSNSSQDDKLRPVPEHSTPPARLPSRGLTDEHRSGSELVQSEKLPDTGSGKEADTESTPTDATLSLSSSLSVHTLESDYDSDSDVYITECSLVVKEPAVKTEHEDEDDESDCGKDGRRSSKKPDSSLVRGDGIQKVDCSKMTSGKSGKMHMQKTDVADSLFDKQLLSNCAVVHLNDSSGFDIKDQEDPEIDADEGLKIPPQNKQESDSGSCLADDTVDAEDVPDEPEEDQPALGASATPGASTTPWSSTTPFLSATPGSSATPGGPPGSSATPESSTTPFPSATPGSSATPASSATPGSSVTPASSATPGSSVTPASSTTPVSIPVHLEMDFSEDVDNTSSPGVDVHNIIAGLIEQDISDTDSGRRDRSASLDDIFDDTWNYNSNFEPETDKTDTADITLALVDSDDGTASASNSDKNNQVFLINPTEELIDMRCTSVGRITPEARKEAERATSVTPETKEKRQEMSGAGKSSSHGSFDEDGERSSSTTGIAASTEDDDNVEDFPMLSTPKRRRLNRQDSQESHSERSFVGEVIYSSDEDTENSVAISDQDQQFGHIGNTKSDGVEDEVCASENSRETDSISEAQPGVSRVNAETLSDQRMFMSMDDLSSTQLSQLDRRLSAAPEENLKNVRRRSLLDKIRAKRKNRQQCEKTTQDKGEIKDNNLLSPQNDVHSEVLDSLNKVEDYLLRGKRILSILTDAFNTSHLHSNPTVQTWRDDLQLLHKSVQLPPTVIAVVGDTGAGKSSLLNALLNQPCVLPTSGVRACTAVVVEIVENTRNQNYEADIHFLSKEEWHEELEVLLKDLTKRDGSLQKGQPDPTSEAGVAYAKVRAVYGKVSKMKVLLKQTHITQWLNRVKKISVQSARHLRDAVNSYIENTDNGSRGEQFWPIVKRVKLYLPSCDVCSSGAVLVDLPGVRDANAARDKIAKEYLKNCTSVWVVASIHRAIDDHTAKDLLGENFRRQLLMDGQYGSVAFICTKTDSLIPSELKKLTPNFETLNDQLKAVKEELSVLESCKKRLKKKRKGQESEIAAMKSDYQEWKKELDQEPLSLDEEEESDAKKQSVAEVQQELENMDVDIQQKEADVTDLIVQEGEVALQISVKEELRDIHQRKLVSMCAKARNEYSKNQIRKDFRAGIRELKQKSASVFMGEEEEDILDYDDGDGDGDGVADEDMGNVVDNLKVFCVSSTDYMKMTSLLTDVDGAPQVFSTPEETEIPALREFVHATSLQRRNRGVRQVVEKLGHFVLDLDNYLKMSGHNGKGGGKVQPVVTKHVTALLQRVDPIVSQLREDILGLFDSLLNPYIEAGSQLASQQAPATNDRWGSKVNKENRHLGGLAFMTYRATVSRQGRYSSPTAGMVDFNNELAEPLLVAVTFCWNKVFGSLFWSTLEKVKTSMSAALAAFTDDIKKNLTLIGFDRLQIEGVIHQILRNATAKLNEMVELMKDYVTSQQREISRIITPNIQAAMLNAYENASREHGAGCYNRMKQMMAGHIDSSRHGMFHNTVQEIKNRLSKLQVSVVEKVKGVLVALCRGFKVAFEPLWQSRDSCLDLRQNFSAGVSQCLIELHQLFQDCGLQFPALTPDSVAEPNVAEVAAAEETVDDVLGALRHDVEDSLKRLEEEPQGPGVKQEPLPSIVSESRDVLNFNYGQEDTKLTEMPPYHSLIKSASTPNTARPASEERQGNPELRQASASNTPTGASACKLLNENLRVSSLHSIIQTSAFGNKFKGGQVCEPSRPVPDSSQVTALVNASGVRESLPSHVLGKHPLQPIRLLDNNRKVMLVLPRVTMTTDAVSRPVMAPVNVPTMNSDAVPKHYYKLCLNANNLKRPASISRGEAGPGAVPIKQEPCDRAQKKRRIQVDEVLDLTGDSDTDAGMDNHSTSSSDSSDNDLPSFL